MLDYATLKLLWWALIGVLLIGFAVMDGHDLGVGTLLPFAGRSDEERRAILNTIGPHWEGNQVWFITAGGALFAVWPLVYATAFSGFYWVMLAILWALFLRPLGFDSRSKIRHPAWRKSWDWLLFANGTIPPFLFGVAFGNLLQGVPFHFDTSLVPIYTGRFVDLFNPFALLCGIVGSMMTIFQGATYLAYRTESEIQSRARCAALIFGMLTLLAFSAAGVWLADSGFGYAIASAFDPAGLSNPLAKTVVKQAGAWFGNYRALPLVWLVPALAYLGMLAALGLIARGLDLPAFAASSLAVAGVVATAGVAMFPFVLPSSSHPDHSLTLWDAASSQRTLAVMLWTTAIFMPLIVFYTVWVYRVMAGKMTTDKIREDEHSLY